MPRTGRRWDVQIGKCTWRLRSSDATAFHAWILGRQSPVQILSYDEAGYTEPRTDADLKRSLAE